MLAPPIILTGKLSPEAPCTVSFLEGELVPIPTLAAETSTNKLFVLTARSPLMVKEVTSVNAPPL